MSVMLFRGMSINMYIIMDGDNAGETVHNLVHAYLKDILEHLQTEEHVQGSITAMVGVKGGQVGRFLTEVYVPEANLSIQPTKAGSTT